jgi:hypothetical protein
MEPPEIPPWSGVGESPRGEIPILQFEIYLREGSESLFPPRM